MQQYAIQDLIYLSDFSDFLCISGGARLGNIVIILVAFELG